MEKTEKWMAGADMRLRTHKPGRESGFVKNTGGEESEHMCMALEAAEKH